MQHLKGTTSASALHIPVTKSVLALDNYVAVSAGSGGKLTTKNMVVVKKAFCFSLNTDNKEVQIKQTCCGVEDKFNEV